MTDKTLKFFGTQSRCMGAHASLSSKQLPFVCFVPAHAKGKQTLGRWVVQTCCACCVTDEESIMHCDFVLTSFQNQLASSLVAGMMDFMAMLTLPEPLPLYRV